LRKSCFAFREGKQSAFPIKPEKKALPVRRTVAVYVADSKGRILLTQRTGEKLLEGLWELPSLDVTRKPTPRDAIQALREKTGLVAADVKCKGGVEHTFSHFKLELYVYAASGVTGRLNKKRYPHVRFAPAETLPLTTATRRAVNFF
jgi:A/G-specific adenine glycosylase